MQSEEKEQKREKKQETQVEERKQKEGKVEMRPEKKRSTDPVTYVPEDGLVCINLKRSTCSCEGSIP